MRQTAQPRVQAQGKKASKSVALKTYGVVVAEETPSFTRESVGQTTGPRMYTNQPTQESPPE